jgi:outer membrane receptor for ferrienterochelin and colicin
MPALNYHFSYPFEKKQARENVITQRVKPSLYGLFSKNKVELTAGGEYFADISEIERPSGAAPLDFLRKTITDNGKDKISISNFALYTNIKYKIDISQVKLNINAGLRYDNNELFGDKVNPRAALTMIYNKFHSKLLFSSAFRAPLVANNAFSRYGLNPDPTLNSRNQKGVEPEKTKVYEFEMGYQLSDKMMVSANVFMQTVDDIIEFRYNYLNDDVYSDNGGKIGSSGIEGEWKYMSKRLRALMNFSFVNPKFYKNQNPWAYGFNDPRGGDTYICPDNDNGTPTRLELLGVPDFKWYGSISYSIAEKTNLNLNALYLSERWAYSGSAKTRKVGSQLIVTPGVIFTGLLKNTEIGLSVHDLFNQRMNIVTGWYDGGYDALPYKGREISVSVKYNFYSGHLRPTEM